MISTVTIGGVTYADTDNVPAISRRPELADLALVGTVLAAIA